MKIAYLILAHNNPLHLERLINALSSNTAVFFVHLDKKADLRKFSIINQANVHLSKKRIKVFWGHFSQVSATLMLIDQALAAPQIIDRLVLLSGTDYPIQSTSYIERFFQRNQEIEFINLVQMPSESCGKPIERLNKYKFTPTNSHMVKVMRRVLIKLGLIKIERDYRKYFKDLIPYGGSTWWALTRDTCQHILNFVDQHPRLIKFYKNTYNPDEGFFQTIIGNAPAIKRIKRNLTYNDWQAGGAHPVPIRDKHVDLFADNLIIDPIDCYGPGEFLFARKFSDDSSSVIEKIDRLIAERNGLYKA